MKSYGPLFSNSASGGMSPCVTFSNRKSCQQVRYQKKQKRNLPAVKQADCQALYRLIRIYWSTLTTAQKLVYNNLAKTKTPKGSGYNYFFKEAVSSPFNYLGLVLYLSFNRNTQNKSFDLSKNGNVATLLPSYPINCPVNAVSKNKKMGNALYFDGVDDRVIVTQNPFLNVGASDFSFGLFVKPSKSVGGYDMVFSKGSDALPDRGFDIELGTGAWTVNFSNTTQTYQRVFSSVPLNNVWSHLFCTVNFSTMLIHIYLNGVGVGSGFSFVGNFASSFNLGLGCRFDSGGYFFNGLIDEVMIFNRCLTSSEILKIYNAYAF